MTRGPKKRFAVAPACSQSPMVPVANNQLKHTENYTQVIQKLYTKTRASAP